MTLVDITIPASAFTQGRYHEVAVGYVTDNVKGDTDGQFVRFETYHAGATRPPHPCFAPPLEREETQEESHFSMYTTGGRPATLRPVKSIDPMEAKQTISHEPGPLQFDAYFDRRISDSAPYAAILMRNGEPVADSWFVTTAPKDGSGKHFVDAHTQFETLLPDTPGIYDFVLHTWRDPFQSVMESSYGSGVLGGSNVLRYRVE